MLQILITLLLFIGFPGVSPLDPSQAVNMPEREAVSIKLTCAELCQGGRLVPYEEKLIQGKDHIGIFLGAFQGAEKLNGYYDYGVYFEVDVQYNDGSNHRYFLNISPNVAEEEGFLVDLEQSTSQGYGISEEWTIRIRELIYAFED